MLRSRPGDFSLSSGRPGDLSLRSSVLPSRYRCGVLGSRGWLGPSGGPGLDATRLVMCSLYVGGPLLLGLLSFKNNGREQLSNKNLTLNFLLAKIKLYRNSQQCACFTRSSSTARCGFLCLSGIRSLESNSPALSYFPNSLAELQPNLNPMTKREEKVPSNTPQFPVYKS